MQQCTVPIFFVLVCIRSRRVGLRNLFLRLTPEVTPDVPGIWVAICLRAASSTWLGLCRSLYSPIRRWCRRKHPTAWRHLSVLPNDAKSVRFLWDAYTLLFLFFPSELGGPEEYPSPPTEGWWGSPTLLLALWGGHTTNQNFNTHFIVRIIRKSLGIFLSA